MQIDLNSIKKKVLEIETFYTELSVNFSREWDRKDKRDAFIASISSAECVS